MVNVRVVVNYCIAYDFLVCVVDIVCPVVIVISCFVCSFDVCSLSYPFHCFIFEILMLAKVNHMRSRLVGEIQINFS